MKQLISIDPVQSVVGSSLLWQIEPHRKEMTVQISPKASVIYRYSAFGLTFASVIECPELPEADGPIDVEITFGKVPKSLTEVSNDGVWFQANSDQLLLSVDEVARYFVDHGKKIIIEPSEEANNDTIRLFLLGSGFGAVLHQRGYVPLHGSAIAINDESAAVFLGASGAGKSTLAATMAQRGYDILSDDIAAVTIDDNGQAMVHPGYPQAKLWPDAAEALSIDVNSLARIRPDLEKRRLPLRHRFKTEPLALRRIYALGITNAPEIECEPLKGTKKLTQILANTYRFPMLHRSQRQAEHLKQCALIADGAIGQTLSRPVGIISLQLVADHLEEDLST